MTGRQGKTDSPEVQNGAQISEISRRARTGSVVRGGRPTISRAGERMPITVAVSVAWGWAS